MGYLYLIEGRGLPRDRVLDRYRSDLDGSERNLCPGRVEYRPPRRFRRLRLQRQCCCWRRGDLLYMEEGLMHNVAAATEAFVAVPGLPRVI